MIISQQFKNTYKMMINEILSSHGLTNNCTLYYNNDSVDYCDNCIFDPITKMSSNIYNNTGPAPFANHTICPQCMGLGRQQSNKKTKNIDLAVIFNSKYFLNFDNNIINIPDVTIQTICSINHINDLKNSSSMSINSVPNAMYERIGDVNPAGLPDLDYIFINWKKQ